jgi:hypothetical protein
MQAGGVGWADAEAGRLAQTVRAVRLHAASTETGDGRGLLRTGAEKEGRSNRCGARLLWGFACPVALLARPA